MRRVSIVIPYLVSKPIDDSALRDPPVALGEIVDRAQIVRLNPIPACATPEAAWLGMNPLETAVAPGPLLIAALGHHPPADSVHFRLTLCSVDGAGLLSKPDARQNFEDVRKLMEEADRLATRSLTLLVGEGVEHALVMENGSLEMMTTPMTEAYGSALKNCLPDGDHDRELRRFIDDSINLLSGNPVNRRRLDEGLQPLNALWPWGQGFRPNLPLLPLSRGDIATVHSASLQLHGLCKLVGYTHADRATFATGLRIDFPKLGARLMESRLSVALIHTVEEMQRHGRVDDVMWVVEQLAESVLEPLMSKSDSSPFQLRILAPGGRCSFDGSEPPERASTIGLGLFFDSERPADNRFPFDERVIDDARLPLIDPWQFIEPGFSGID
ncbi:MAG: hypothetical protein IH944_01455 [Armatimonadetes bacterium]|nr:hypothetical protein [Armatimonadota bacterium]